MIEAPIQRLILARLALLDGVYAWRANTGAARAGERLIRYGKPGQADISGLIRGGRRLEIEVKSPTGTQSTDQKDFQRHITDLGGLYVVARSLTDALAPVVRALYPAGCPHPVAAIVAGRCVVCVGMAA